MTIHDQSRHEDSSLSRFLAEHLPALPSVALSWWRCLGPARWAPREWDHRTELGTALELRVGLDLGAHPAPWRVLSFLPPDRCAELLAAAGFDPASGLRASRPDTVDGAETRALAACVALALLHDMPHLLGHLDVAERREWFVRAAERFRPGLVDDLTGCLVDAWAGYLRYGRSELRALGDPVVVAPEFAGGFGIGDLVTGRTLVEVEAAAEPSARDVEQWLRQLLGYVLLDRSDDLRLDAVAVYAGWQGQLLRGSLAHLLRAAGGGPATPDRAVLRAEFHDRIRTELDGFAAWRRADPLGR